MIQKLINFLNNCDLKKLNQGLDELDKKIEEIFLKSNASIDDETLSVIQNKSSYFFCWFCFLRANFLRGKDITSNRAFRQFLTNIKWRNYYFDNFPQGSEKLLPQFSNPKFQQAKGIEEVLQQLRRKYKSGYEFVKEIKEMANSYEIEDIHRLYLELISKFMSFNQIGSKIANAIIGETLWELTLLRRHKKKTFQNLLKEKWIRKLALASCFNVMIDTHVRNFFKEKLNIKDVQHSILIFLANCIKPELIEFLFDRNFKWIPEKKLILKKYQEYVGANVIEKLIWVAYFVIKNSRRSDNINNLQFFQIKGNPFL
ncbi:MAG: hypothetical protein COS26_00460 [Candidatus Nealsonbacteria bacterium CG02_land_8_20_14_3_00_40_11]|uniref:HhH-GPD domain-containing protein n=1 Tax=Candidatus Nealsonbacteria bacterium CG02_land_8_20_14_3_00_40_11 TaxID=1974700 RepID=A0A2M7D8I0_9BACT|nr:MAG: hypothetical protein COS26_00460 [Candidatus Nealsonbacteria bacterium CG02_land_8_20_14_3_00_40_11]